MLVLVHRSFHLQMQRTSKAFVNAFVQSTGAEMSALGQKPTCAPQKVMSALPPKADMCSATANVCFGPKADIAPPDGYPRIYFNPTSREQQCRPRTRLRSPRHNFTAHRCPALSADGGGLIFDRTTASSRRQSRVSAGWCRLKPSRV